MLAFVIQQQVQKQFCFTFRWEIKKDETKALIIVTISKHEPYAGNKAKKNDAMFCLKIEV